METAQPQRARRFARTPKAEPSAGNPEATGKAAQPASKIASVVTLLKRERGATLAEMIEATGWLPHTTRAALTGLKKKGHIIERTKRGDVTCYRVTPEA